MPKSSQKLTFTGSQGDQLAARLDLPEGSPKAYVLFAHCFTCSKDIFAASRIAGQLADLGFGVLRFDFTGLGASEGEFANTNFSSNVQDLLGAVDHMRTHYAAPQILVGHSLGGAAVLAAAADVPEAKAVATIGAPADAEHVTANFGAKTEEIEQSGLAEVNLAGRTFTIKRQFLEDVRGQRLDERIAQLGKALMVFHAPLDDVVGIDNAAHIFKAAKHPKSFISLDKADHLLHAKADAAYVASVLSAWAERYIEDGADVEEDLPAPEDNNTIRVGETGRGKFQQQVIAGKHRMFADEPSDYGGDDTGPSPYDYLAIALGACTTMTLRMYAGHKGLALDRAMVDISHRKIHAEDCEECSEGKHTGRVDRFERLLSLEGNLSDAERKRLVEIADKCPVHQTLEKSSVVTTRLKD